MNLCRIYWMRLALLLLLDDDHEPGVPDGSVSGQPLPRIGWIPLLVRIDLGGNPSGNPLLIGIEKLARALACPEFAQDPI